jgi:L-malate glycosyltransferase
MMKVWVIPSWYPPRGGFFFQEHSQALARAGARVTVVAGLHTSLKQFPLLKPWTALRTTHSTAGNFREITRKFWIIPFSDQPNARAWIRSMVSFFEDQVQKYGPPDIIQVHSSLWAGVVAARLNEKFGFAYVITEHRSRFVYNTPESKAMFQSWHHPLLQQAFERASYIITVSDALQERILHYAPGMASNISSVPNMVDVDFFSPPASKQSKPETPFTFFSLAHHIRLKGLDTLLDAFAQAVSQDNPNLRLVIGGDGPERPALERQCRSLALEKLVQFTGELNRQQVKQHMQAADAFVLPSRFEAFGVVFIEAMACGLPVIAARAGGPETFITPETGMLVPAGQPQVLAEAMLQMAGQPEAFSTQEIRKYAAAHFSKEAVAGKYLDIYRQILK